MNQQPLFYKKIVPLNKDLHKNLYIEPAENYAFAKESNSLYIAAVEFAKAVTEYPIVFGSDGEGKIFPVALLGLRQNQNLFTDEDGKWNADYIPAYTRRYPFILAQTSGANGQDQFTVCIDEGYAGFNTAREGKPLFDDKGEESPILKQAVDFLKDYQSHIQLTTRFCDKLAELEILQPVQADIEMKTGDKFSIGGFQCVNRDKLKNLPAETVKQLLDSGELELIHIHLLSLNNIHSLMNRII